MLDAIAASGKKINEDSLRKKLPGAQSFIYGEAAYDAPLLPGDMVFYLFQGCQYGGHAVTVIDDLGESFTHISGNTGDAISVGIGEAKRMKTAPAGFQLDKATPAPVAAGRRNQGREGSRSRRDAEEADRRDRLHQGLPVGRRPPRLLDHALRVPAQRARVAAAQEVAD